MRRLLLLLAALLPVITQAHTDKTLQHIKERKAINIAYRTDAAPFSYEEGGQPTGS
jgi:ABC-type amino acid transport substrate-binding protein